MPVLPYNNWRGWRWRQHTICNEASWGSLGIQLLNTLHVHQQHFLKLNSHTRELITHLSLNPQDHNSRIHFKFRYWSSNWELTKHSLSTLPHWTRLQRSKASSNSSWLMMQAFLQLYKASWYTGWTSHANMIATAGRKGPWLSWQLQKWSIDFCKDKTKLPTTEYGKGNVSILEDEDICNNTQLHLQSLGKWVSAMDIVCYIDTPEFQAHLKLKRSISEWTARNWMQWTGFQWGYVKGGQYKDGHESNPVVTYRQGTFVPQWRMLGWATWHYNNEIDDAKQQAFIAWADSRIVVIWRHDESTFYANDRHKLHWIHQSETAQLSSKTEGLSVMISEFISSYYGWLWGKAPNVNGEYPSACVYFKAGKNHNGYQNNWSSEPSNGYP